MITVCGAKTDRADLPTVVERPEGAGSRWLGIPHRELADSLVTACRGHGLRVTREQWAVGRKGAALVGGLDVCVPGLDEPKGQGYTLAYMGANDLSRSNLIACGTNVLICNNGVCTGTFVLSRKHTTRIDLDAEMNKAVDLAVQEFNETSTVVRGLQERRLTAVQVDRAFMEVGRRGVLPWSGLGKAWKQYGNPEHEEFREYHGRAWGVYQAVNVVIKDRNPVAQIAGLNDLTEILAA